MEAVRSALEDWGGAAHGTRFRKFRKVTRGAWVLGDPVRPSAVVVDTGSARDNQGNDSDTTKSFKLNFQVLVNLDADFGKGDAATDWTDVIETVKLSLQNFNPGRGVLSMNVTGDEPIRVEMTGGDAEHVWVIEGECVYFVEVAEFAGGQ